MGLTLGGRPTRMRLHRFLVAVLTKAAPVPAGCGFRCLWALFSSPAHSAFCEDTSLVRGPFGSRRRRKSAVSGQGLEGRRPASRPSASSGSWALGSALPSPVGTHAPPLVPTGCRAWTAMHDYLLGVDTTGLRQRCQVLLEVWCAKPLGPAEPSVPTQRVALGPHRRKNCARRAAQVARGGR